MILVPMTALVVAAYFILITAERAQDPRLKTLGKYLSLWVLVLSGLLVVGAALGPGMGEPGFRPPFPGAGRFGPPGFPPPPRERLPRPFEQSRGGDQKATTGADQSQDGSPSPTTPAP